MSTLSFGTSGVRGLAPEVVAHAADYTRAFLMHIETTGYMAARRLCVARDLRASSPDIVRQVCAAATAAGYDVLDCGCVATPALAHFAIMRGAAAIMVTGSHIPADRNGLKFFTAEGEIGKGDEAGILAALGQVLPDRATGVLHDTSLQASDAYAARYDSLVAPNALAGMRIGVFEQSSVMRDTLADILGSLGAEILRFDRADVFVPVDTEALSDAVFVPIEDWVKGHALDALVSTDGDGDRPLLADETGRVVRGDALGALTAKVLGATTIAVPVTANSALEAALSPARLVRTRVGSPYVLAAMDAHMGHGVVLGFEANGGVMLGSDIAQLGLSALPTRDALLPLLCCLGEAARRALSVSHLVGDLNLRAACADRVADVPRQRATDLLQRLQDRRQRETLLGAPGEIDTIDGVRIHLDDGGVIHFRASGNAPEMRCYSEAETEERAEMLLQRGLDLIRQHTGHT